MPKLRNVSNRKTFFPLRWYAVKENLDQLFFPCDAVNKSLEPNKDFDTPYTLAFTDTFVIRKEGKNSRVEEKNYKSKKIEWLMIVSTIFPRGFCCLCEFGGPIGRWRCVNYWRVRSGNIDRADFFPLSPFPMHSPAPMSLALSATAFSGVPFVYYSACKLRRQLLEQAPRSAVINYRMRTQMALSHRRSLSNLWMCLFFIAL